MRRLSSQSVRVPAAARSLAVVLLLLAPSLPTAVGTPGAGATPAATVDPAAASMLLAWATKDDKPLEVNATAADILARLKLAAPLHAGGDGSGWEAYFAALGLSPTETELSTLNRFRLDRPAVARLVEELAGHVARAQVARDEALAGLDAEERGRALTAAGWLALGLADQVTAEDIALLDRIDIKKMATAASALETAAALAAPLLHEAQAADEAYSRHVPRELLDAALAGDASAVLSALAGDAVPLSSPYGTADALAVLQFLHGTNVPTPSLPEDLDGALAPLLWAHMAEQAHSDDKNRRIFLATLANALPALTRAAHNLSLESVGTQDQLAGRARPILGLTPSARDAPLQVVSDLVGPGEPGPRVAFTEGLAALHAALGQPLPEGQRRKALDVEADLPLEVSLALGSVLAAQAAYERDLSLSSPVPQRAAAASEAARPILDSARPVSPADLLVLQENLAAQKALRALTAARTTALLFALSDLQETSVPFSHDQGGNGETPDVSVTNPLAEDIVYRDQSVVILGTTDSDLTAVDFPATPVLLVDLGGNDTYGFQIASVVTDLTQIGFPPSTTSARTSIAVDLAGNDTYLPPPGASLAAAGGLPHTPTLAYLSDVQGGDRYVVDRGLGWAQDGLAFLVDLDGDDVYHAVEQGLGFANATALDAISVALVVDALGNDEYRTGKGFSHLAGDVGSPTTAAVFLEISGADKYVGDCPKNPQTACFGTPRADEESHVHGVAIFIDNNGADKYPRSIPNDPARSDPKDTMGPKARVPPAGESLEDPSNPDPSPIWDGTRLIYVSSAPVSSAAGDRDGDFIPDIVEGVLPGFDPEERQPRPGQTDSDADGWPDFVEQILGTDPQDPKDAPVGRPRLPEPVPDPWETTDAPGSGNETVLLDLPPFLKIGTAGTTWYTRSYLFTLDLGLELDEGSRDYYLADVARNGVAIDLGGDDIYRPVVKDGESPPALASSWDSLALLVDLSGNDLYESGGPMNQSYSAPGGLAILLDAQGSDTYLAGGGTSQAFSEQDGGSYFFDLTGDDRYTSPTQGFANITTTSATSLTVALFLDAAGNDVYSSTALKSIPGAEGDHQGASNTVPPQGTSQPTAPPAGQFTWPLAAFLDLGGRDTYWRTPEVDAGLADLSAQRNGRLVVRPLDDPRAGALTVFADLGLTDGNTGEVAESLAGTDPSDPSEAPTGSSKGFVLDLPRLGLGVGAALPTRWTRDYALSVDLGGPDVYKNRAGTNTPRFGAALHVDLSTSGDEEDHYSWEGKPDLMSSWVSRTGEYRRIERTATNFSLIGTQGAGILGIGVLWQEGGQNEFRVESFLECNKCGAIRNYLLGVAQGAGLAGVGILSGSSTGSRFTVDVRANGSYDVGWVQADPLIAARTVAQGAAINGIGVLAMRGTGDDSYLLTAQANGTVPYANTTGQGYAYRGLGVLVDDGGNNVLMAADLAQAAAESNDDATPILSDVTASTLPSVRGSLAMLLFTGSGNDALVAHSRAQAYSGQGGSAFLYDASGHDVRTLTPPIGKPSFGQAMAENGGIALLVDVHGDDRYVSETAGGNDPDFAQAVAIEGTAILVDLSGNDVYSSRTAAQAHVWTLFNSNIPGFAALFDRAGMDSYVLDVGAYGQGSVPESTGGRGAAFFVDASGRDFYSSRPLGVAQWGNEGNDATSTHQTTGRNYLGVRIDNGTLTHAMTGLAQTLQANGLGGAQIKIVTDANEGGHYEGLLVLSGSLKAGTTPVSNSDKTLDRVDFYFEDTFIGRGDVQSTDAFLSWDTEVLDADGKPRFPDGTWDLSAYFYARGGTPHTVDDATDHPTAVDPEPIPATMTFKLDNPPLPRLPPLPLNVSATAIPHGIPLWVDRDLERNECPACDGDVLLIPGPDEWQTPAPRDALGNLGFRSGCTTACQTDLGVYEGAGKAWLIWEAPTSTAFGVAGYRILREAAGETAHLATVDPRGERIYLDKSPVLGARYRVDALWDSPGGVSVTEGEWQEITTGGSAGAVSGLRAMGTEGGVALTWNPAPGAQSYEITRIDLDTEEPFSWTAQGTRALDAPLPIGEYTYQVAPAGSLVPARETTASTTPGHQVQIWLEGLQGTFTLVNNESFTGSMLHHIPWDVADSVPDGSYKLFSRAWDGSGRSSPDMDSVSVALDRAPPVTTFSLPAAMGGPHFVDGMLQVPFVTADATTGVAAVLLAYNVENGQWQFLPPVTGEGLTPRLDGSVGGVFRIPGLLHGQRIQIVVGAVDFAGNLEGLSWQLPWVPTIGETLLNRATLDPPASLRIDLDPPALSVNPLDTHVRSGTPIPLSARASDPDGLPTVRAHVGTHVVALQPAGGDLFVGQWTPEAGPGTQSFQVQYEALDAAGNSQRAPAGRVVVDDENPYPVSTSVAFPGGRETGRAGETVRIVLDVRDNGTSREDLVFFANVTNVSSRETARPTWSPSLQAHVAEFPVNRLPAQGSAQIRVTVVDRAGNLLEFPLPIRVDSRPTNFSTQPSIEAHADRAVVTWTTEEPVRGRVMYGEGLDLGRSTPFTDPARNHSIVISPLRPDTEHFVKAVVATDAGVETASDLLSVHTLPGLNVTLSLPSTFARQTLSVEVEILTYKGEPSKGQVDFLVHPPRGSAFSVLSDRLEGAAEVALDVSALRDGEYRLSARVQNVDFAGESAMARVVIDRTPPLLDLKGLQTLVAGQTFAFTAVDRGSGVDLLASQVKIGDTPCTLEMVDDLVSCRVPTFASDGEVQLHFLLVDRAGNEATRTVRARLDGLPPEFVRAELLGPAQQPFVSPGEKLTLRAKVSDSTLQAVSVDLRQIGLEEAVALHQVDGWHQVDVQVPPGMPEGEVRVTFRAVDRTGRETRVPSTLTIDSRVPSIESAEALGQGPGRLVVTFSASEPVRATLRVPSPQGAVEKSSDEWRARHTVALGDLRPGRELSIMVEVTDRAGHKATHVLTAETPPDVRPPTGVGSPLLTDLGNGKLALSWEPARDEMGIDHYVLTRVLANGTTQEVTTTATRHLDLVPADVALKYEIRAVDVGGNRGPAVHVDGISRSVPQLSGGTVDPPVGAPGTYEFRVNVTYAGRAPLAIEALVNGVTHLMTKEKTCETECAYRAFVFVGTDTLQGAPHRFSFRASSNGTSVAFPAAEEIRGPVVLGIEPGGGLAGLSGTTRVPTAGTVGTILVLVASAACLSFVLIWRKRK